MTNDQAISEMRKIAEANNWPIYEPIEVYRRSRFLWIQPRLTVISNAEKRGRNIRVVFDAINGEVLEQGYVPR